MRKNFSRELETDFMNNVITHVFYLAWLTTTLKTTFSTKDFFSKYDQILRKGIADLVTFTEEILNGKLHFAQCTWCR